jgi:hypothetical protein
VIDIRAAARALGGDVIGRDAVAAPGPTPRPDGIVGLLVKLDRPVDREQPCCRNVCIIGAGKGPHAGDLHCADCGQHRGWLSQTSAQWIESVVKRFGAPSTPIVVRKSHTDKEEAPATNTASPTQI